MEVPKEKVRNIGIIAHIDAGKTTTTERILYYTHKIHKIGEVDEGSATMDWMEEEKERGITITSAATTCYWKGYRINIIDTPGHIDFTGEVERSLQILDGAVVIFSAVEGVESQSEVVWRQADKYKVPRIVYINKLDRIGADVEGCINTIREKLNREVLELQFPIGNEKEFCGVCDLIEGKVIVWDKGGDGSEFSIQEIPPEYKGKFEEKRYELIEKLALEDEEIENAYLLDECISKEKLFSTIRRLVIEHNFVPIFMGASKKNIGVQPLLDGVINFLPSPLEVGKKGIPQVGGGFCGYIFKIQTHPHGRFIYLRVYSGKIKPGEVVFNLRTHCRERITHMFLMHANKKQPIWEAEDGDIIAVYGPKNVYTGDILTSLTSQVKLSPPTFPDPVVFAKIEAKSSEDEKKLPSTLSTLTMDDPTLKVKENKETGEILLGGMGELHLEVTVQRMEREFLTKVKLGHPQVAYKETIKEPIIGRGRVAKESSGQYGEVVLKLVPQKRGKGVKFETEVKEEVPKEFIEGIKKGVEENLGVGVLAGFPVVDLEVKVMEIKYHPQHSSQVAFEMAGSFAMRDALTNGKLVLLEPEMKLEIVTPPEFLGNVLEDLNKRGSKVVSLMGDKVTHTILAICPLRKLFGYATALRSITQGKGIHVMKFETYREVPQEEEEELLKKLRGY